MNNLAFEAERQPNVDEVWEWFEAQNGLIAGERLRLRRVLSGQVLPHQMMLNPALEARFRGNGENELVEYFERQDQA